MAQPTDITTGLQTVSAAGAVTGTYDASALVAPFEVKIQVASSAPASVTIAFESSAAGTFADKIANYVVNLPPINAAAEQWISSPWYMLTGASYGSANNKFRLEVLAIASAANVAVHGVVMK